MKKKEKRGFQIYFITLYGILALLFASVCVSLFFKDTNWTIAADGPASGGGRLFGGRPLCV